MIEEKKLYKDLYFHFREEHSKLQKEKQELIEWLENELKDDQGNYINWAFNEVLTKLKGDDTNE